MSVTLSLTLVLSQLLGVRSLLTTSQAPPGSPHFTSCVSREQETFRCWWTAGIFQNLTEPGALKVFFQTENVSPRVWSECPDYGSSGQNVCFFDKSHTSVWTQYCVQLRSAAQAVTYDELCFNVQNIVHPDAPVRLNWTLLNMSRSGFYDVLVHWEPPPSADVKTGWMSLVYQVRYRAKGPPRWHTLDLETGTHRSIYGLRSNIEYEVQVRCKMRSFENFGEYSDTILVHVAEILKEDSRFPITLTLTFTFVTCGILLLLIVFSQQQRLMVIFLPPVPAPKIKGIDPELLKKGKLDTVSSILRSKADLCSEDPWVEYIELDLYELDPNSPDSGCLLPLGPPDHANNLNFRDDDSGRVSCCDPDFDSEGPTVDPEQPPVSTLSPLAPALAHQPVGPCPCHSSWSNLNIYTQVSDVNPSGEVMLSPDQRGKAEGVPELSTNQLLLPAMSRGSPDSTQTIPQDYTRLPVQFSTTGYLTSDLLADITH